MSSCRLSHKDRHLAGKPVGVPHFVLVAHSWPLVLHGWPHIWQHGGFYSLRVQNFHKVRAEREAAVGEARELPFQRVCAASAQSSDATSAFNNLTLFPSRHSFMRCFIFAAEFCRFVLPRAAYHSPPLSSGYVFVGMQPALRKIP